MEFSFSPDGQQFKLPEEQDYIKEYERLEALAKAKRKEGKEIVVVMGLGFVGAVMAGVVADSVDKDTGAPGKYVIGMQRPSPRSFWKIPLYGLTVYAQLSSNLTLRPIPLVECYYCVSYSHFDLVCHL